MRGRCRRRRDDVLELLLVETQIGNDLPQLAVLVFELLQSTHLGRQQTVIFALPVEIGGLTDSGLAAVVGHRHPL